MQIKRLCKQCLPALVVLAVVLFVAGRFFPKPAGNAVFFHTATVNRADVVSAISASGVVEPEEVIDVGAQVAGRIVTFGKDSTGKAIDYGSVVEEGTVLARIDDALFASDVAMAKAQLSQAKTGVMRAEADLMQLQAKLFQVERDWGRARKLGPSDAMSYSDYDAARSAYEMARANVEVGKAAVAQSKDSVAQAAANLERMQQNLDYCTIRSPVKGVIVDRRVNIGQTVVASLNAPSLFLIAKDLTRLQVWISVNEADIGHIRPGQPVNFTVDAFPGEIFRGEVVKIRLNAAMTQNVVTYTVEVTTDNADGKLLPYMTANARFIVAQSRNVLTVPNAALRWSPQPEQVAPDFRKHSEGSGAKETSSKSRAPETAREKTTRGVIWCPDGDFVKPFPVTTGATDGSVTEIRAEKIEEGTVVVTGAGIRQASGRRTAASPFTPQYSRKGGGGGH